jgi:hypothetical protein
MTYVPDGDAFTRAFGEQLEPGLVAVGWLDAGFPYDRGKVPAEFIDRLREKCRNGINRTRGLYRCTLCPRPSQPGHGPPLTTTVHSPSGDFVVGSAEIRVEGSSGTRYASPDMIIHYVEAHGYLPPEDYIDGVLRDT